MSRKYTEKHEWIDPIGDCWRLGITDFAQQQLGDVVMVELPDIGRTVAAGEVCAVIESVKAASDIYTPVAGQVVAVNEEIADNPAIVNESPETAGWLLDLKLEAAPDLSTLMDAEAYARYVEEEQ